MHYTVHGVLQARILEWVAFPFSRGSSQPRDWTQVSRIAGRFFTSWVTVKPKNTGMGSLSLLQGIFLTQESNQGLLHRRWILYQLSYWGRPSVVLLPGESMDGGAWWAQSMGSQRVIHDFTFTFTFSTALLKIILRKMRWIIRLGNSMFSYKKKDIIE